MSLLGNILWLVAGGLIQSLLWMLGGVLLCCTIVGLPLGLQAIRFGKSMLAPFGKVYYEHPDANSFLRVVFNIIWLLTFGWSLAMLHLGWAGACAVTVIGIPFALQHIKLIPIALMPFGRELRSVDAAS